MAGALIVTAELAPADFAWVDGLRRAHYPAERNRVPAHLTLFHALPPSAEAEVRTRLGRAVRRAAPRAVVAGLMDLGSGTALRVVSSDLDEIRDELARELQGLLGVQDSGGWRPHLTIQNKVPPKVARALREKLERSFSRREISIRGLGLHRYLGGAWEPIALYPFRG